MYNYIIGDVKEIFSNSIVLENGGIGYLIHTSNPYHFEENKQYKIYIYQHLKEDENTLYGFKDNDEKNLFLKLIDVKGLGPKMAMPMLATGSISGIVDAIERENILYLKKFPKIGDKVARQIILDLKGKLVSTNDALSNTYGLDDLIEALKGLGYKQNDINKILPNINKENPIETQIKEALKLLLR